MQLKLKINPPAHRLRCPGLSQFPPVVAERNMLTYIAQPNTTLGFSSTLTCSRRWRWDRPYRSHSPHGSRNHTDGAFHPGHCSHRSRLCSHCSRCRHRCPHPRIEGRRVRLRRRRHPCAGGHQPRWSGELGRHRNPGRHEWYAAAACLRLGVMRLGFRSTLCRAVLACARGFSRLLLLVAWPC